MKKLIVIALVFSVSCTTTKPITTNTTSSNLVVNGKLFTTAFQQRSAEYAALCLQAYNIAYLRLDQALMNYTTRPKAIITDVDETVLDNSAYAAHRGLQGLDYEPTTWTDFVNMAISEPVPGSLAFLQYAASNGVEIFYITNRDKNERAGTISNLKKFGYPNADETHLLTREGSSGKESRRKQVAATHEIVLLIGDNLSDFADIFDKKLPDERMRQAQSVAADFGGKFILLPNPVYGDWELALYQYKNLAPVEKDSVLKSWLKSY